MSLYFPGHSIHEVYLEPPEFSRVTKYPSVFPWDLPFCNRGAEQSHENWKSLSEL